MRLYERLITAGTVALALTYSTGTETAGESHFIDPILKDRYASIAKDRIKAATAIPTPRISGNIPSPHTATITEWTGDCTTPINGSIVYLTRNITFEPKTTNVCMNVGGVNNVTLDCQHHSITTTSSDAALIYLASAEHVTIKNCRVENKGKFGWPIDVYDAKNVMLRNNTIVNGDVDVEGSKKVAFLGNDVEGTYAVSQTEETVVSHNSFSSHDEKDIAYASIEVQNSGDVFIEHNTLDGNWDHVAKGNKDDGTDDGIFVGSVLPTKELITQGTTRTVISDNDISNYYDTGVEGGGIVTNSVIDNNVFTNEGVGGIGAWFDINWRNNVIIRNIVKKAPSLFNFTSEFFKDELGNIGKRVVRFRNTLFAFNKLASVAPGDPAFPKSSGYINFSETVLFPGVDPRLVDVSGTIFYRNNFGEEEEGPAILPFAQVQNAGGNICNSDGFAFETLVCNLGIKSVAK